MKANQKQHQMDNSKLEDSFTLVGQKDLLKGDHETYSSHGEKES